MRTVEFSPHLPPKYQEIAKKILLSFILKPEQTKKLVEKLVKYWDDQQQVRLGQLTFVKAIWHFLIKGDQLLEKARENSEYGEFTDLYAAQNKAFEGLKQKVSGYGEDFANLVLCLWITKQKLGMGQFCKSRFSFWNELLRSYPEIKNLFRGPGVSLAKPTKKMSKVQPKPKPRRRKPVRETTKVY